MNERNTWFFAAMPRSSFSNPCSLRAAGTLSGFVLRIDFGTVASIIASSEA